MLPCISFFYIVQKARFFRFSTHAITKSKKNHVSIHSIPIKRALTAYQMNKRAIFFHSAYCSFIHSLSLLLVRLDYKPDYRFADKITREEQKTGWQFSGHLYKLS